MHDLPHGASPMKPIAPVAPIQGRLAAMSNDRLHALQLHSSPDEPSSGEPMSVERHPSKGQTGPENASRFAHGPLARLNQTAASRR